MEVTVKTTELSDVLRLVRPVTEKRTTIPILGTVLLSAERNRLLVTGTDLETGAICPCPATVRKPGKIAIPAQRLHEYVKVLPEGELDLKAQASNWLSLTCNRSRSRIAGLDAASSKSVGCVPALKSSALSNRQLELVGLTKYRRPELFVESLPAGAPGRR